MKKFQSLYEEALGSVTINPSLMKTQINSKLTSLPNDTKNALSTVADSIDDKNPVENLILAIKNDPNIIKNLTPEQKEELNKVLNPLNADTTQSNGQTKGLMPTLDKIQNQKSPSNYTTKPLI